MKTVCLQCIWFCSALTALAACSEAYFSAVAKMGEQALHTFTSHALGKKPPDCVSKFAPRWSKVLYHYNINAW